MREHAGSSKNSTNKIAGTMPVLGTGMWRELQLAASASADVRPDRTKTKTSAGPTRQTKVRATKTPPWRVW